MAEKYIMIHDIMSEHRERMLNLKKFYPFFVLCDTALSQYKEGRYVHLDMGYITMATLRFLINENSFHEREVTYEQYEEFLLEILRRDFALNEQPEEEQELVSYIFDKIKNDGRAFTFPYFDPEEKKKKTARVKLIDSRIYDGTVLYHVTTEGIEFYLDTKEIKDESNISVNQLLLEKMIRSENFSGGIDVVRRINNEVGRLILKKKEVLDLLRYDVFAGAKACREYMDTVAGWFDEEQRLFEKNRKLIDKAFQKANAAWKESGAAQGDSAMLARIHSLDTELKRTITRHGELIRETIELQRIADEMIARAKLRRLRPVFQFQDALQKIMEQDCPEQMEHIIAPLLMPRLSKSFAVESIDRMLESKTDTQDYHEKREKKELQSYVFADELEDQRIAQNYGKLFGELLEQLWKHGRTTLRELTTIYEIKFGKEIWKNGDLYSFLVHLAQKESYDLKQMRGRQDTFLEGLVMNQLSVEKQAQYGDLAFEIRFLPGDAIRFPEKSSESFSITDMEYVKKG